MKHGDAKPSRSIMNLKGEEGKLFGQDWTTFKHKLCLDARDEFQINERNRSSKKLGLGELFTARF